MSAQQGGTAMHEEGSVEHPVHPTADVYLRVGAVLVILTVLEVGVFYVPAFHPILVPVLLVLSAAKFTLVVMFYMHLKADSKFFTFLFGVPLMLAVGVMVALLFLFFGALTLRGAAGAGSLIRRPQPPAASAHVKRGTAGPPSRRQRATEARRTGR